MSSEKSPYREAGISARNIAVQPSYKRVKKQKRGGFCAPEAVAIGRGHSFRELDPVKVRHSCRRVHVQRETCHNCGLPRFVAHYQPCKKS